MDSSPVTVNSESPAEPTSSGSQPSDNPESTPEPATPAAPRAEQEVYQPFTHSPYLFHEHKSKTCSKVRMLAFL